MKIAIFALLTSLGPFAICQELQQESPAVLPQGSFPTSEAKQGPSLTLQSPSTPGYGYGLPSRVSDYPASALAKPLSDQGQLAWGQPPTGNPHVSGLVDGNQIGIQFMTKKQVWREIVRPDGTIEKTSTFMPVLERATVSLDTDLEKIELAGDGKRVAVQAITTHRHRKLLQALKDANTEAEKEEAAKKLEENYRAHYASETKWRLDRIAELEKRMEEMRAQVKERVVAEEKFLEAAMTLAKLNAQGIAAEPPLLKATSQAYSDTNQAYSEGQYATFPSAVSGLTPLPSPMPASAKKPAARY